MDSVIKHLAEVEAKIKQLNQDSLAGIFEILESSFLKEKCIYVGGNGGSATMAEHFCTDWTKGIYEKTGRGFRSFSLSSNTGLNTAIVNDIGGEHNLVHPLKVLAKSDDVLILISSSGKSKNILLAGEYAKSIGMMVIGLTGFGLSPLAELADLSIVIDSSDIQVIEDIHGIFGHLVYKYFTERYSNYYL